MRVKPSVGLGVGIAAGYMALFGALFALSGVDYDELSDTAENVRDAVVIPLAIAAVVLIVLTSFLGWWRPVLREQKRAGGWVITVPIVMFLAILAGADWANIAELDSELLLYIGIGVALVGFCEELVYRGLVVVSFRSTLAESQVWLWSSVAFGLLHAINFLLGQDLGPTVVQVFITAFLGSLLYVARRATGFLVVPMVLHLLWDYASFTQGDDNARGGIMMALALILVIASLTAGRKYLFGTAEEPVDERVAA